MKKNLVLTVDFGKLPAWAITAKSRQIADWLTPNQEKLGIDNIIIFPQAGETRLFWLDANDLKDMEDINPGEELQKLSDKFRPVLSVIINTKMDEEDPGYKKAVEDLKQLRELQLHKKTVKDTKKK